MSVRLLHRYYEKLRFLYCLLAQVLLIVPGNTLVCAVFFPASDAALLTRMDSFIDRVSSCG